MNETLEDLELWLANASMGLPLGHADTRKSTVVDTEVWKWQ